MLILPLMFLEILSSHVEDLIVTFEHRPVHVKVEPRRPEPSSVENMFQLDGQVDMASGPVDNRKKNVENETRLTEAIARVKAKTHVPQGPVRLHAAPSRMNTVRREPIRKSKPIAQPLAKPSTPVKRSPEKERGAKPKKTTKKIQPPLYQALMKKNEDAIRSKYPYVMPGVNPPKVTSRGERKMVSMGAVHVCHPILEATR